MEILMIKKLLFLFVFVCSAASAQQSTNPQQALNQVNGTFFIPNQGQWNRGEKYLVRIEGMNAGITNSEGCPWL